MIIDKIKNASFYYGLGLRFKHALQYLSKTDFHALNPGSFVLNENNTTVKISNYITRDSETCKAEAHQKYADIQYIIEGKEAIGYTHISLCSIVSEYDENKDVAFYTGELTEIPMRKGYFAILFPEDVHKPGLRYKEILPVKKAIVKILL